MTMTTTTGVRHVSGIILPISFPSTVPASDSQRDSAVSRRIWPVRDNLSAPPRRAGVTGLAERVMDSNPTRGTLTMGNLAAGRATGGVGQTRPKRGGTKRQRQRTSRLIRFGRISAPGRVHSIKDDDANAINARFKMKRAIEFVSTTGCRACWAGVGRAGDGMEGLRRIPWGTRVWCVQTSRERNLDASPTVVAEFVVVSRKRQHRTGQDITEAVLSVTLTAPVGIAALHAFDVLQAYCLLSAVTKYYIICMYVFLCCH